MGLLSFLKLELLFRRLYFVQLNQPLALKNYKHKRSVEHTCALFALVGVLEWIGRDIAVPERVSGYGRGGLLAARLGRLLVLILGNNVQRFADSLGQLLRHVRQQLRNARAI